MKNLFINYVAKIRIFPVTCKQSRRLFPFCKNIYDDAGYGKGKDEQCRSVEEELAQLDVPFVGCGKLLLHLHLVGDGVMRADGIRASLVHVADAVTIAHLVIDDGIAVVIYVYAVVERHAVYIDDSVGSHDVFLVVFGYRDILGGGAACHEQEHDGKDDGKDERLPPSVARVAGVVY